MATYKTEQKKELIKFLVKNSDKSFTIDEICEGMEDDASYITPPGRSTVYRLIPKLLDENIIKQINHGQSRKVVYQIVGEECGEHLHLKCTSCGKIFHMSIDESEELSRKIQEWNSFEVNISKTVIFGICENCKKGNL